MKRLTIRVVVSLLLVCFATGAWATTYIFKTSDNLLDTVNHSNNSGWWSDTDFSVAKNDNYLAGIYLFRNYRNFFSFDLSSLDMTNKQVVSAKLVVPTGIYDGQNLTYSLYDVSTDVNTLADTSVINLAIYNDLGSGTSYGSYAVSPATDPLKFDLNAAARNAIGTKGWFSIGGDLTGGYLFSTTQHKVVSLEVTTAAVPEPATLLGFGIPVLMIGLGKIRGIRK